MTEPLIVLLIVLTALAVQRVVELVRARRNAAWLRAQGARFVRDDGFAAILAVHVLFFVLPVLEAWAWGASFGWWTVVGAVAFLAGQALRYHAMRHLGRRWNTRVYVLPQAPLVASGLYGRIRHPNYLGVSLELAGLPLTFGLWRSAIVLTLLNGVALARRIRIEETELGITREAGPST